MKWVETTNLAFLRVKGGKLADKLYTTAQLGIIHIKKKFFGILEKFKIETGSGTKKSANHKWITLQIQFQSLC